MNIITVGVSKKYWFTAKNLINMKSILISSFIVLLAGFVHAQEMDNTLGPEEFVAGWELLFDGESFDGWKAYNGMEPEGWTVDDNALHCTKTADNDIMTMESFGDFDLKFDWKIEAEGNSGVIYRVREGKQWRKPYLTGPEYQVFDDAPDSFDVHATGSFYDVYAPSKNKKVNPAMEWNSGRIRISKGLVTHWVNGEIVMQCQLYSDEWNEKVAVSKWKNNPYFGKSPYGHIDLQSHGHEVWFKNLKILRL